MTLSELLRDLESKSLPDEEGLLTIYASRPWSPTSPAIIMEQSLDARLPEAAAAQGLDYFIEVSIAQDWLREWPTSLSLPAEHAAFCERLIYYAENDA